MDLIIILKVMNFFPWSQPFKKKKSLLHRCLTTANTNEDRSVIKAGRKKEDSKPDTEGGGKQTHRSGNVSAHVKQNRELTTIVPLTKAQL